MSAELELPAAATDAQRQARRLNELQDAEEAASRRDGRRDPFDEALARRAPAAAPPSSEGGLPAHLWILLVGAGLLLAVGVYQLGIGVGEGAAERDAGPGGAALPSPLSPVGGGGDGGGGGGGGAATPSVAEDDEDGAAAFSRERLVRTRKSARDLITLLHDYYGGEDRARAMLAGSWQAPWALRDDDDGRDERRGDDAAGAAAPDAPGARAKAGKEGETRRRRRRRRRFLGKNKDRVKAGVVLDDPDRMTPTELEAHRRRARHRTSKVVATLARALLDPDRDTFVIGTIGSSVAAGHDNCHYDAYEGQLERTLAPVFEAAGMTAVVENAGEGGGCGDTHKVRGVRAAGRWGCRRRASQCVGPARRRVAIHVTHQC